MIVVFVTFESKKDAFKVAKYLVDQKIAACVSILPVDSFYYWKGEKVHAKEYEGVIKTSKEKFDLIKQAFVKLLPYEIAQIIAVSVEKVNASYLRWLKESLE